MLSFGHSIIYDLEAALFKSLRLLLCTISQFY